MTRDDPAPPCGAVHVGNRRGRSRLVLSVDHATNAVPDELAGLGLDATSLASHVAWDPGALEVATRLGVSLDAPVVRPGASRLVIDVNRDPAAPDSIVEVSDGIAIPGNAGLDAGERERRVRHHYHPFHRALEDLMAERVAAGGRPVLVSVHSFTPELGGRERPWDIGVIHDRGRKLADALIAALDDEAGLVVGRNEPYGPGDRVYHTLAIHAEQRGVDCAMLEIRSDRIADTASQARWAARLAAILAAYAHG